MLLGTLLFFHAWGAPKPDMNRDVPPPDATENPNDPKEVACWTGPVGTEDGERWYDATGRIEEPSWALSSVERSDRITRTGKPLGEIDAYQLWDGNARRYRYGRTRKALGAVLARLDAAQTVQRQQDTQIAARNRAEQDAFYQERATAHGMTLGDYLRRIGAPSRTSTMQSNL